MNPLPPIKKALATIEEMMGKFGSEEKRNEAKALIQEKVLNWLPVNAGGPESVTVGPGSAEWKISVTNEKRESLSKLVEDIPVVTPPVFQTLAEVPAPAVVPTSPLIWPEKATVSIFAACINPRLLKAKLEDGRDVTFEVRRGCKYRRGQPVKCRRVSTENAGNPMYAPC